MGTFIIVTLKNKLKQGLNTTFQQKSYALHWCITKGAGMII